ncbi:ABC transporter ATP-binding protein [Coraliomargarita algicola]|uniref:ABC transporter ATP-binding protein n=1 Tax=Coraliomargarita algicola TaxID=3092156 RepID=A0ABZ0RRG8_9BACT|nr:ABC transporter ATP-binding protein [Coraliomargarita sp. J2-16]WPJ97953.1 ABC transporter ATP-binding protein [Coraliomargarita sp. J2-16]
MMVPEGRITACLGSNGAGKTTTIKLLLGLHHQDSGSIEVLGEDSRKLSRASFQNIAYVSENQLLPLWMTVEQLLKFSRPLYKNWDINLEANLLKRFELDTRQKLKNLSRGQQMKAALLANLAYRPKLVVLDEPFSGLDPLVRDEFIKGLLELTEDEGWSVFISSHDIEEVERLADQIAIIDKGHLKLNESTDALLSRFREVEIRLADSAEVPAALPDTWLNPQQSGRILRFTHCEWKDVSSIEECAVAINGKLSSEPSCRTLSLREIFIQLAQNYRLDLQS